MNKPIQSEDTHVETIEKLKLAQEYRATIEAKLRKAERHLWMIKDLDYLEP